jgi:F-box protein 18 (helicase)
MKIRSTPEQMAIRKSKAHLLIVKAFAGTGKTTTLVGYAEDRPNERILYLAYNKAMQVAAQAKFPRNVECKTTHSLAYKKFGRPYADANKLGNVRGSDIMMTMRLDPMFSKTVLETVNNYIYSADEKLTEEHVPSTVIHRRDSALECAEELWAAMRAMPGEHKFADRIRMPHDGYLKLYQLSKPDLTAGRFGYSIVLADEWQDANPVAADIVSRQRCTRVMVGDSHQAIYGFRKSVDALNIAAQEPEAEVLYLTTSFRFGADIASLATALLSGFKMEPKPLLGVGGADKIATRVDTSRLYTKICRTNAQVFSAAAGFLGNKRVNFIGGVDSYPFERLVDVQRLAEGKTHEVQDAFFKSMGSLAKLQDYVNKVNDPEIGALLAVQKEFSFRIPGLVDQIRAEAKEMVEHADVQLTTAHRSKGLEFEQVVLADDFEEFVTETGEPKFLDTQELNEELNLLYVAATRASHALEINSSILAAVKALGEDDEYRLPPGTQDSAWTKSLLAGTPVHQAAAERQRESKSAVEAVGEWLDAELATEDAPAAAPAPAPKSARPTRPTFQPVVRRRVVPSLAEMAAQNTPDPVAVLTSPDTDDALRRRAAAETTAVLDAAKAPMKPWDRARFRR